MRLSSIPLKLDVEGFFRWWGSQLAFLVPVRLKKLLGRARPVLILRRSGDGVQVLIWENGVVQDMGLFPFNEDGARRRETLWQERPELQNAEVLLDLTPAESLVKRFRLPAATEENLEQVTGFELGRLTPFRVEEVYYHARLIERLPETKQILIELALTPRRLLDPLLQDLTANGWFPDRVEISADPARRAQQLLPEGFQKPRGRLSKLLNAGLGALAATLALLIVVLPIWQDYRRAGELEQELRRVSKVAREVDNLRQDSENLTREARFVLDRKRSEPALVDVLNELSRVIPDNTWLYGLQYKDRRVVIQGQSPSASSLIALVEASPYFHNTSFVSPVTKDVSSGFERFQIASEVINGRFPAAKPEQADQPEQSE
jgi:general secretion pathway protein L